MGNCGSKRQTQANTRATCRALCENEVMTFGQIWMCRKKFWTHTIQRTLLVMSRKLSEVVCSLDSFSLYALHSEISLKGLDRRPLSQEALSAVSFLELCAIWLQKKRALPHTLFSDGKSTLIWCDRYEDRLDSVYGYLVGFYVLKHVETIY